MNRHSCWVVLVVAFFALVGCNDPGAKIEPLVQRGEFGAARGALIDSLEQDPGNRNYMYERSMLAMSELADGLPESANRTMDEVYRILRTQGINADKTVLAVATFEHVRFWKGEPFEQALLWNYLATQRAMIGEWDNARAAAQESLFHLKSFGEFTGKDSSTESLAKTAIEKEQAGESGDYLRDGYKPTASNFVLGYLMTGVANQVLSRKLGSLESQANDRFDEVVAVDPTLGSLVDRFRHEPFNTVIMVDYGFGPTKVSYGMDDAFAKFEQQRGWRSDAHEVHISVNGSAVLPARAVCDVNVMATDLMWNNMEDVRVAKSILGTGLLVGGGIVAAAGNSNDTRMVGLGMAVVGMAVKASARADVTHSRILPQRTYLVPVMVEEVDSTLEVMVEGDSASRVVLPAVDPPSSELPFQMLYVRLVPLRSPPAWTTAGRVLYGNDHYAGSVSGDDLPYILGGRCVRSPTAETLDRYQAAGHLAGMTLVELQNLYREEGIAWTIPDSDYRAGRHVLEGGNSLIAPRPGSVGYLRVLCKEHERYAPKSDRARMLWSGSGGFAAASAGQ